MHNIEKYDQSISADSLYYRLGETVMGRLCNVTVMQTQCEMARPGESIARSK